MMCKWLRPFFALVVAALSLAALACSSPSGPVESPSAEPTPDIMATITALAQRPGFSTPAPTPVPQNVLESAQEFSRGLDSVNKNWDQLHLDYDTWQAGLFACDPRSVAASLNRFDGRFAAIVQSAMSLSRSSATREFSDQIISAAEAEQQALRSLRDNQGLSGSAGGSSESSKGSDDSLSSGSGAKNAVSEATKAQEAYAGLETSGNPAYGLWLDQARSDSSAALQMVSDAVADLEYRNTDSGRAQLNEFTEAFVALNDRWDIFHQKYDAFRADEVHLTSGQVVAELSGLISEFSKVVAATRELPQSDDTQYMAWLMGQTADSEDLVLRKLRANFQKESLEGNLPAPPIADLGGLRPPGKVEVPGQVEVPGKSEVPKKSDVPGGSEVPEVPETPKPTPTPQPGGFEFVPQNPDLFGEFEAQLVSANASRREATTALDQLNSSLSQDRVQAIAEFSDQFEALLVEWNSFHQDYDEWQADEGGCDRQGAVVALLGIGAAYHDLSAEVGALPNTLVLRPYGDLLVEAVRRESLALDDLKNRWRPFDAGIYQRLREARAAADNQRRQVVVGIQDLLAQYGVSPN